LAIFARADLGYNGRAIMLWRIRLMRLSRLPYKIKRGLQVYSNLYVRRQLPILIYSTGRVGSMALHYSLEQHGAFAFQIHTLDPVKLIENQQPGTARWAYNHIIKAGRPAQIINLYRDPLALMISDFFPKLRWITGQQDAYRQYSVAELCELFITRYFEQGRHREKLDWYETEMQASLGIDIYAHQSPRDTGYTQFTHPPYEVLLLKTEMDDLQKAQLVGAFCGLQNFSITRRNTGDSKDYGDVYKAFKQQLIVPAERLDEIYESRYARHVYTSAEIAMLRSRWQIALPR
jgi:hypothetical protein